MSDQLLAENEALHALLADASDVLLDVSVGSERSMYYLRQRARACLQRIKEGDTSGRQGG